MFPFPILAPSNKDPMIATFAGGIISGTNNPPYSISINFSVYTGNWVYIVISAGNSPGAIVAPTVNGVSCTLITQVGNIGIYRITHPGSGTYTCTSTWGGGNNGSIHVFTVTGQPEAAYYDLDINEATNTLDIIENSFSIFASWDSSSAGDTITLEGVSVVDVTSSFGGDSASFAIGHKNHIVSKTSSYAMSAIGNRFAISFQ